MGTSCKMHHEHTTRTPEYQQSFRYELVKSHTKSVSHVLFGRELYWECSKFKPHEISDVWPLTDSEYEFILNVNKQAKEGRGMCLITKHCVVTIIRKSQWIIAVRIPGKIITIIFTVIMVQPYSDQSPDNLWSQPRSCAVNPLRFVHLGRLMVNPVQDSPLQTSLVISQIRQ